MRYAKRLKGKKFCIIAFNAEWPGFLEGRGFKTHLKKRGAAVVEEFDETADFIVVGSGRKKGRADAIKKAKKLKMKVHDEVQFFKLLRHNLKDTNFAFTGGFSTGAAALDTGPEILLSSIGANLCPIDKSLDFLVVGDRRAKGKTADLRKAEEVNQDGGQIQIMSEHDYMSLLAVSSGEETKMDFPRLVVKLRNNVDAKKLDRSIKMLKKESYDLYGSISDTRISGIVKSQTSSKQYYAPWIGSDGKYSCYGSEMYQCMGLQGKICKHILVLLLGLTQSGELDMQTAFDWTLAARGKRPLDDEDESATALLRYKGVEAGTVDWRPTETVPEDFYIL
jgi:hypothetical protein